MWFLYQFALKEIFSALSPLRQGDGKAHDFSRGLSRCTVVIEKYRVEQIVVESNEGTKVDFFVSKVEV